MISHSNHTKWNWAPKINWQLMNMHKMNPIFLFDFRWPLSGTLCDRRNASFTMPVESYQPLSTGSAAYTTWNWLGIFSWLPCHFQNKGKRREVSFLCWLTYSRTRAIFWNITYFEKCVGLCEPGILHFHPCPLFIREVWKPSPPLDSTGNDSLHTLFFLTWKIDVSKVLSNIQ